MIDTLYTVTQAAQPITTTQVSMVGITMGILLAATVVFFMGLGGE